MMRVDNYGAAARTTPSATASTQEDPQVAAQRKNMEAQQRSLSQSPQRTGLLSAAAPPPPARTGGLMRTMNSVDTMAGRGGRPSASVTSPQPVGGTPNPQPQSKPYYSPDPNYDPYSNASAPKNPNDPSVNPNEYWPEGYRRGQNGEPVPERTGMLGDAVRRTQKYGTPSPKAWALPAVRVSGVDFNPADFQFNGVNQGQWNQTADQFQQRNNPTGDWAQSEGARDQVNQGGLARIGQAGDMFAGMANGTGPSLAQGQLQQGVDKSIAAQMSMANSMRGGSLAHAGAMRDAALAGQQMQGQAVGQAALLRNQEQMQGMQGLLGAGQAYGGLAGTMRGQDIGQQQAALGAYYQGRGQNDQAAMGLYGLGHQAAMADLGGRQAFATTQGSADLSTQVQNAGLEQGLALGEMDLGKGIAGATLGAATGLARTFA